MPIYGSPTFCAASAIGPTGNPTTPNMYWTPWSFRLFASKSAPLISAIFSLLSVTQSVGGRTPSEGRRAVRPNDRRMPRGADYLFIAARQMGLSGASRLAAGAEAGQAAVNSDKSSQGGEMRTSQDRILTTHVGSLPRPQALRQLLVRKDQGEPYDKAELARLTRQAVFDIVRRQADTGIDIVNDGEMSKPGYSTYVADR